MEPFEDNDIVLGGGRVSVGEYELATILVLLNHVLHLQDHPQQVIQACLPQLLFLFLCYCDRVFCPCKLALSNPGLVILSLHKVCMIFSTKLVELTLQS